ncbi:MAG: hypothetical protein H8M99_10260 [Gloeobacteraceae cyanobacterium ES-bin-144]|nr:hypothetical protein [Verrucomicrobiales bacterium]
MIQNHHSSASRPLLISVLVLLSAALSTAADPPAKAPPAPALDDVAVKLEPCDVFPYVEPGAKGKVSFLFTSKSERDLTLKWKVRTALPIGKAADIEENIVLPKGGTKRIPMPDQVTALRGVVTFTWQLTDQDGRRLALKDNLGVMTLPGPETTHRSNFRYGWGNGLVHFVNTGGEEKVMPTYAQLGIDLIRVGDKWAYSESRGDAARANSNNNYWADTSLIINGIKGTGMDILYVMWGTPPNLARKGFSHDAEIPALAAKNNTTLGLMERVRPPDPAAWRMRVKDTVTKFKDSVKYWELWNDQDRYNDGSHHMPNGWVGSTDEYLELLRDGSKVIKEIDPSLKVVSGGCFTIDKTPKHDLNPDMQDRIVREAQDAFDIQGSFDTSPALLLGPMATLRKEFKTPKPLWLTRVEQHGASADELVRRLLSARGCGASAFVWMWALSFDSGWRGALTHMGSWKTKERKAINVHSMFQMQEAGCAYVHAIGLLRMLTTSTRFDTGTESQWVFAFSDPTGKDTRRVYGLFHNDKMPDGDVKLTIGAKASSCSLLDVYGNATPLVVTNGSVSVPIRYQPAYVLITDSPTRK